MKGKNMNIVDLELSVRAHNVLEEMGITTIEQLAFINWIELAERKKCGAKTIAEIAMKVTQLARGDMLKRAIEWEKRDGSYYRAERLQTKLDAIKRIVR